LSKGQINTVDLIVSLMIFIMVLTIGLTVWNTSYARINDLEATRNAHENAYFVTNELVKGPGAPTNWNSSNVIQIGLADKQNVVTFSKWNELHKFANTTISAQLGVTTYNAYLVLKRTDGTIIDWVGLPTNSSTRLAAVMLSYVVFNSTVVKLEVTVWQ